MKVRETAKRMIRLHNGAAYARSSEHACSYESNSYQFKFWKSVGDEILKLQREG